MKEKDGWKYGKEDKIRVSVSHGKDTKTIHMDDIWCS